MLSRPVHRWKSFWLGVLVLAFFGWAWVRSLHRQDGFLWMTRDFHFSAAQTSGAVEVAWAASDGSWGQNFLWMHEAVPAGEPTFRKAVNWETYPGQLQLTVSHWLLMLVFLVPWAGFLLWRHRRMKRLAAAS
jgi:hypothetical protein